MSNIAILQCDTCGRQTKTNNIYKEGWIEITGGQLTKGFGMYDEIRQCYQSQWVDARIHPKHFCSWYCLQLYGLESEK